MGRRNHAARRPQARRKADGTRGQAASPPPPVESLVVPRGRCYFGSRKGKLRFAETDVAKALRQAKANRARKGSGYVEDRAYPCPDGGCGDWHLTSRSEWTERGKA